MALTQSTLADLRKKLMARLGYAAVADVAGSGMQVLLNSFLTDAHEQLATEIESSPQRRDWIMTLVPGQALYELPTDDCDRTPDYDRILGMFVEVSGNWTHLPRGINPVLYSVHTTGIPTRYDIAHGNGS